MPRDTARHQDRRPRSGTRPHQVLHVLTHAARGMRVEEINAPGLVSAPTRHIADALQRLQDIDLVSCDRGVWVATKAGFAAILEVPPTTKRDFMPAAPLGTSTATQFRRDIALAPRLELPLVLRPGAEDYRQHPSRRGNTLVWDHLDGRKARIA